MKIHRYETIYPRTLWIVNCNDDNPKTLTNRFKFYVNSPGWKELHKNILEELDDAVVQAIAGCYIVEEKSTGDLGILLVIFRIDGMTTASIAHESVHIADFYYEVAGCNSEDYTEGNEAYAYLVGWIAGCIANVLIKERNGKTE